MGIFFEGQRAGRIRQRALTDVVFHLGIRNIRYGTFHGADYRAEVDVALHKEHHVRRLIVTVYETQGIFAAETAQQFGLAEDVPPQRMVRVDEFFKIVEDKFRRTVFVALNLVDDYFYFLVYLLLRERAVEHDVGKQFHGAGEMFFQKRTVHYRFFFIGISIQVAAHVFHAVKDMPRTAFLRTFKNKMLYEVCHSLLARPLIARTRIYGKAAICHVSRTRSMD